jgi:hypothetical protein
MLGLLCSFADGRRLFCRGIEPRTPQVLAYSPNLDFRCLYRRGGDMNGAITGFPLLGSDDVGWNRFGPECTTA